MKTREASLSTEFHLVSWYMVVVSFRKKKSTQRSYRDVRAVRLLNDGIFPLR